MRNVRSFDVRLNIFKESKQAPLLFERSFMNCPHCGSENSHKVLDKRNDGPEDSIRRRRECLECGERFTTYELRSDMIEFASEEEDEDDFDYEEVLFNAYNKR